MGMSRDLNVKLSGSADDIQEFVRLLCFLFDGRVLSSRLKPNQREPGYHTYCLVRMDDLQPEFRGRVTVGEARR
jgi:hypothetical protein